MRLFVAPFTDLFAGLQRSIDAVGGRALALLLVACAAGWWLYVPVHELMHAWGAQLGGATVTRLDIDPIYGARFLQRIFPYVQVGSAYAGQLTGFDTHGSDLAYALTVFFPFVLSVAVGVPLLVHAAAARPCIASTLLIGFALPIAWAPILSIGGDFYELGAIAVSRAAAIVGVDGESWRGGDVVALIGRRFVGGAFSSIDAAGVAASLLLGIVLAFATYAAGRGVAAMLAGRRQPP